MFEHFFFYKPGIFVKRQYERWTYFTEIKLGPPGRAVDPDPHGYAFIFPPGPESSFKMWIRIRGEK